MFTMLKKTASTSTAIFIESTIATKQQFFFYAIFNALSLLLSLWVSVKAFAFFFIYIGAMWLYSHALKKPFGRAMFLPPYWP